MVATLAPVAALLASVAILLMGHGLQGTLLPVRASMESFSALSIGMLGSAYYVGFAAGCLLGPAVVRRAGHIRTFTAMAAIASAAPLVHALALLPSAWWPTRAVTGFAFAVLFIVIESWLNERSTRETRGFVLSVYMVINLTVMTLGQLLIAVYDPKAFTLFAFASILVSLAAVPVALTGAAAPPAIESVQVRPLKLYHTSPVGFVACLLHGVVSGSFWALGPLYAERSGFDVSGIAFFMSATVLGGAAGQWPMGRLSDHMDRRVVLVLSCAGALLCAALIVTSGRSMGPATYVFASAWGFFSFPVYALAMAHTNDFADRDELVQTSSGLLLLFAAGAIAGPLLSSPLLAVAGTASLYAFTATVHAALIAFTVWRIRQREAPAVHEQVGFAEAMQNANTVSTVFAEETLAEEHLRAGLDAAGVEQSPEPE